MISAPKVMVAIFWSLLGFPVINALPPRIKFAVHYFGRDIIPKIVEGMPFHLADSPVQLMLHMDKIAPHRPKEPIRCLNL
jgi:hypothetical protein